MTPVPAGPAPTMEAIGQAVIEGTSGDTVSARRNVMAFYN